jgi:hypothetical protein
MHSCLLLRKQVYPAFAQKRPWYFHPSRRRFVAMVLHPTINTSTTINSIAIIIKNDNDDDKNKIIILFLD